MDGRIEVGFGFGEVLAVERVAFVEGGECVLRVGVESVSEGGVVARALSLRVGNRLRFGGIGFVVEAWHDSDSDVDLG